MTTMDREMLRTVLWALKVNVVVWGGIALLLWVTK